MQGQLGGQPGGLMSSDMTDPRQTDYLLRLRPVKGCDEVRAMKRLLKYALRTCGFRAVEVRPADETAQSGTLKKGRTDPQ